MVSPATAPLDPSGTENPGAETLVTLSEVFDPVSSDVSRSGVPVGDCPVVSI